MKLSEIVQLSPHNSKVVLRCEIDPQHEMKNYAQLEIERIGLDLAGVPTPLRYSLRVCEKCLGDYIYFATQVYRNIVVTK